MTTPNRFRARAWDKKLKKFTLPTIDNWDETDMQATIGQGNENEPPSFQLNNCERYTWIYSTGLVDKKGKTIFEGDIVKFRDDFVPEEPLMRAEVEWRQGSFVLQGADRLWEMHNADDSLSLVIIGNIYEDKDLLDSPTDEK